MVIKKNIDLIEYKIMRSSPTVRLTLDIGEVSPEVMKAIHELKMLGGQQLAMILVRNEDLDGLSLSTNEEEE